MIKLSSEKFQILLLKGGNILNYMVQLSEILDIINQVLETSDITEKDINEELSVLGISSIMIISIVIAIEEKYNIEIPDEYLLNTGIGTINKILGVVTSVMKEKII